MAKTGLSKSFYALYDANNGNPQYSNGGTLGKAVDADIALDGNDTVIFYADNGPAESAAAPTVFLTASRPVKRVIRIPSSQLITRLTAAAAFPSLISGLTAPTTHTAASTLSNGVMMLRAAKDTHSQRKRSVP